MPDLSSRSQQIEIMDDLNCSGEVVDQTLRELETINRLLGGNAVTVDGTSRLLKGQLKSKTISIADLGCGGGDIMKLIYSWGKKNDWLFKLVGIDANPNIIAFAKKNSISFPELAYEAIDIFSEEFKLKKFDIMVATLFFHHFSKEQLVAFFTQAKKQVRIGIVINDIHRHWFAYHSIRWLTKIFSRSAMVKFDAPLSVQRAFTKNELLEILEKANIKNYTLRWMWAFRWQVVIKSE